MTDSTVSLWTEQDIVHVLSWSLLAVRCKDAIYISSHQTMGFQLDSSLGISLVRQVLVWQKGVLPGKQVTRGAAQGVRKSRDGRAAGAVLQGLLVTWPPLIG